MRTCQIIKKILHWLDWMWMAIDFIQSGNSDQRTHSALSKKNAGASCLSVHVCLTGINARESNENKISFVCQ